MKTVRLVGGPFGGMIVDVEDSATEYVAKGASVNLAKPGDYEATYIPFDPNRMEGDVSVWRLSPNHATYNRQGIDH